MRESPTHSPNLASYILICSSNILRLHLDVDVDIQGHGIELAPISNLLDFDIDIELEFCCLDVHDIDIWNLHERLNSEACLDGHSLHWNCTLM